MKRLKKKKRRKKNPSSELELDEDELADLPRGRFRLLGGSGFPRSGAPI